MGKGALCCEPYSLVVTPTERSSGASSSQMLRSVVGIPDASRSALPNYVRNTSGVPQIGADLSRRPSRQPWAKNCPCSSPSSHCSMKQRTRLVQGRMDTPDDLTQREPMHPR